MHPGVEVLMVQAGVVVILEVERVQDMHQVWQGVVDPCVASASASVGLTDAVSLQKLTDLYHQS